MEQAFRAGSDGAASDQAARIRRGDRRAFKALFHAHYEPLFRYAFRYVRSVEVAEDLVQDVFLDLWVRRASWHPRHSPKAYLFGAVRNQTLNHRRGLRARNQHAVRFEEAEDVLRDVPSAENPERALHGRELAGAAQRAIKELPSRRRHIFILSREHDLTYAEIAAVLSISIKTVETQMGRALRHLRQRLPQRASLRT